MKAIMGAAIVTTAAAPDPLELDENAGAASRLYQRAAIVRDRARGEMARSAT